MAGGPIEPLSEREESNSEAAGKEWAAHYAWHDGPPTDVRPTMLETLGAGRIVEIDRTPNGIRFVDGCDNYFGFTLSIDQTRKLIAELQAMLG